MLDFAIFAVCFLSALLIAILWLYPSSKRVTTIPGMNPSTKEDGNLSDIGRAGSLHEFLVELHKQYGPIAGFWFGQMYTVSIASPELFKQHSNVFDRPVSLFKLFEPFIGPSSIQYANGTDGRYRRKQYDRAFSHERLKTYYEVFQKCADTLVKKWSLKSKDDHVALSEDSFIFSLRSALLTVLGGHFRDEKLLQSFRNAYDKAWSEMEHRLVDPILPDKDSSRIKQFDEAITYMLKTVKKCLEQREESAQHGFLVVDEIMSSTSNSDILTSDSITYLVAAFHTSGNLLTWCLYFLATHEDVQEKVYKEVIDVLGKNGVVEDSNLGQLKYIQQVLDETLRCAVIAPWGARYQDFNSELGGHKIPKNTPVIHAFGVVLHDDKLWPLPKKFDPDRFSEENRKQRHPYAFQPFGFAGGRKCPGYKFSYAESTVLLASIIQKFQIKMHGDQVVLPVYGLVTHPADEIWIQIIKRS